MSYCRWSSNNFNCDLYCYHSDWGFETHVAGGRYRWWVRFCWLLFCKKLKLDNGRTIRYGQWFPKVSLLLHLPRWTWQVKINHECAGKSFTDETEQDMVSRVKQLVNEGFRAPKFYEHL